MCSAGTKSKRVTGAVVTSGWREGLGNSALPWVPKTQLSAAPNADTNTPARCHHRGTFLVSVELEVPVTRPGSTRGHNSALPEKNWKTPGSDFQRLLHLLLMEEQCEVKVHVAGLHLPTWSMTLKINGS